LAGLRHLIHLDLSHNDLASLWLPGQPVFGQLTSLRHLNLAHNRITELDSGLLADLTDQLESLDLSANQIGRLAAGQFRQLSRLVSLRLEGNRLASIGPDAFHGLTASLELLSLANNSLGYLHAEALQPLAGGLRVLRLNANQLTALPVSSLSSLAALIELDLSNNQLREVNLSHVLGPQLRVILLSDNALEQVHLPVHPLTPPPPQLERLDLSGNRLSRLGPDSFAGLPRLTHLSLAANLLEDINGVLPSHPALATLNIAHNRLKWFDMAFFPRQLRHLDLRGNEVEELGNYYRMVEGFQLRHLDASNNKIASLGPHTFVVSPVYTVL
jgi:Leucine-rich repeat (LRR) protein